MKKRPNHSNTIRRALYRAVYIVLSLVTFSAIPSIAAAQAMQGSSRQRSFSSAAQEFGVPENVLLALSYDQTHWEANTDNPSINGGYGPLNLTVKGAGESSGRGDLKDATARPDTTTHETLSEAAQLVNVAPETLKANADQNIRAGAALLADYANQLNGGSLPTNTNDWYGALAEFSGSANAQTADLFANTVFSIMQKGEQATTTDGQSMSLPATPNLMPNRMTVQKLGLKQSAMSSSTTQTPECPPTLNCTFVPAYYGSNNPNDATDYGNYDYANRPKDIPIKYIYIHDTEGSYDSTVAWLQNPASYVSAQYVINTDGSVTQMVTNEDVSWGINDWYLNPIGINIEHVGYAATGSTWYTPAMYKASATLVQWLAAKYHISTDRSHIIGHDEAPTLAASRMPGQHWDPGPFWNWNYYMGLINNMSENIEPTAAAAQNAITTLGQANDLKAGYNTKVKVVTISPTFASNQPVVTDCQSTPCTTLPTQGANFVYLHTQPSSGSPLLTDPYVHTDASAGNTNDSDWGDKAVTGARYVVAGEQNGWTGIYYSGHIGWFYNPNNANVAPASAGVVVTPKAGMSSVGVYGGAYPEASAYPSDVPIQSLLPLYTISAGQSYVSTGTAPTLYFYDQTWNYSAPDDHAVIRGNQKYYEIELNHRIGFVKADDVNVSYTLN
ncbi:MAG: N-acetylmuramoyl-L-alanine amidase [Candidatus Saccharibacteria bacterium]